ncbi:MAG: pirin-like C-terminal cupin domain-containing protein [Deltaproteobacteria bacterium]|nr:pirin-like C-terminal cupin domain-containing protein [Deltaproteobacteria bacterium]
MTSRRFLFLYGRPLGGPVARQGSIAMNTQEELRIACEDYQRGIFVKQPRLKYQPGP